MSVQLLKSKRKFLRYATISVLCLLPAAFTACSTSNSNPRAARANATQAVQVTVASARKQDLPIYLTGLGSIQAYYTVSVKSRVDGQLVDVRFKEGQFVKQGELLAVIDPRPYQVALEQAQAQSFKDQASLRDAKLNYQRYKDLLQNSGAMSQQQVDTQQATVDQLDGAVRNDQAAVDSAKLNLVYCHITAPVSGRIGLRLVDPGNIVHASDTNPMLVITQLQPITAVFTLPEDQLPEVAQHLRKGPLQVDAYSRDDLTKLTTGKLLTIDNQIDQTTGTGRLKAVFENKESALWPNQFVNVHLLLETQKNVTVVPSAAVQRGPQGDYVYVMKPDKTVEVRPVNTSVTQGSLSLIASGVTPGEMVVTDGQDKLQQGSRVEPHTQGAGTGTRSAGGTNGSQAVPENSANTQASTDQGQAQHSRRSGPPTSTGNPNRGTASQ
ncbi:MAG TPA: MdtA/MuxA family multidrug efflux RND transporter periplasmic adaptor subunit [Terriglobales bacterium]|nr:MdtA/MuxA family multidrug efflux RND transporter periplasmic adaptor subunit [Terriglobales bacterium]